VAYAAPLFKPLESTVTKTIQSFVLAAAACTLLAGPVLAKGNAQQGKMKECNAQAAGKKGDERKAFMKECLGAKAEAEPAKKELTPQQAKMKECAAQGKGKKGKEHKAFMKECLSAK
jgi:hypothetical protein